MVRKSSFFTLILSCRPLIALFVTNSIFLLFLFYFNCFNSFFVILFLQPWERDYHYSEVAIGNQYDPESITGLRKLSNFQLVSTVMDFRCVTRRMLLSIWKYFRICRWYTVMYIMICMCTYFHMHLLFFCCSAFVNLEELNLANNKLTGTELLFLGCACCRWLFVDSADYSLDFFLLFSCLWFIYDTFWIFCTDISTMKLEELPRLRVLDVSSNAINTPIRDVSNPLCC